MNDKIVINKFENYSTNFNNLFASYVEKYLLPYDDDQISDLYVCFNSKLTRSDIIETISESLSVMTKKDSIDIETFFLNRIPDNLDIDSVYKQCFIITQDYLERFFKEVEIKFENFFNLIKEYEPFLKDIKIVSDSVEVTRHKALEFVAVKYKGKYTTRYNDLLSVASDYLQHFINDEYYDDCCWDDYGYEPDFIDEIKSQIDDPDEVYIDKYYMTIEEHIFSIGLSGFIGLIKEKVCK